MITIDSPIFILKHCLKANELFVSKIQVIFVGLRVEQKILHNFF